MDISIKASMFIAITYTAFENVLIIFVNCVETLKTYGKSAEHITICVSCFSTIFILSKKYSARYMKKRI